MIFDRLFMVKNIDPNDLASNEVVLMPDPKTGLGQMSSLPLPPPYNLPAGTYVCVQVAEGFSFSGSESWSQEISFDDYEHNQYNPVFFDLTNVDPLDISETLISLGAPQANEELVKEIVWNQIVGELFKNGTVWPLADKLTATDYFQTLINFSGANVGKLAYMLNVDLSTLQGAQPVTVLDRRGVSSNVNVLTVDMLLRGLAECQIYKRKFPDGTE